MPTWFVDWPQLLYLVLSSTTLCGLCLILHPWFSNRYVLIFAMGVRLPFINKKKTTYNIIVTKNLKYYCQSKFEMFDMNPK